MTAITNQQLPAIMSAHTGATEFMFDKRRDGFRLAFDTQPAEDDILQPEPLIKTWEERIPGSEFEERVLAKGCPAGQLHAEMIYRRPIIAQEWADGIFVFLGTDWRGPCECRLIPCLKKTGENICLFFVYLGDMFTSEFLPVILTNRQLNPVSPRLYALE